MNEKTTQPLTEAQAITKAIALTENGGKIDTKNPSAGKSGELKSIFQFTPETWANDSEQVFGKSGAPMNADTEAYVTTQMVDKWLQKGYKPSQIFSMWNAGVGEPDAYTGKFSNGESSAGTNKHGVQYDVKSYVDKANKYLSELSPSSSSKQIAQESSQGKPQVGDQQYKNAISTIVSLVKKGQNPTSNSGGLLGQAAPAQPGLIGASA